MCSQTIFTQTIFTEENTVSYDDKIMLPLSFIQVSTLWVIRTEI